MSTLARPSTRNSILILYRFGNFIGEAEESEEESLNGANGHDAYVDDEAEEDGVPNNQALMEVDGQSTS